MVQCTRTTSSLDQNLNSVQKFSKSFLFHFIFKCFFLQTWEKNEWHQNCLTWDIRKKHLSKFKSFNIIKISATIAIFFCYNFFSRLNMNVLFQKKGLKKHPKLLYSLVYIVVGKKNFAKISERQDNFWNKLSWYF